MWPCKKAELKWREKESCVNEFSNFLEYMCLVPLAGCNDTSKRAILPLRGGALLFFVFHIWQDITYGDT